MHLSADIIAFLGLKWFQKLNEDLFEKQNKNSLDISKSLEQKYYIYKQNSMKSNESAEGCTLMLQQIM